MLQLNPVDFRAQTLARAIPLARTSGDILNLLTHLDTAVLMQRPKLLLELAQVVVAACVTDPDVLIQGVHFCVEQATDLIGVPSPLANAVVMWLNESLDETVSDLPPPVASHCRTMIRSMIGGQNADAMQVLHSRALPDAALPAQGRQSAQPGFGRVDVSSDWVNHLAKQIDPHSGLGLPTREFAQHHRKRTQELGTFPERGSMMFTQPPTVRIAGMEMHSPSDLNAQTSAIREAGRAYLQTALVKRSWHEAMVPTLQTAWLTYVATFSLYVHPTAMGELIRRLDRHESTQTVPPFPLPKVLQRLAQMEGSFERWIDWLPALFQSLEPSEVLVVMRSAFGTLGELLQETHLDGEARESLQAFPGTVLALAYRHWLSPDEEAFEALADLVFEQIALGRSGHALAPLLDLAMIFATEPGRATRARTAIEQSSQINAAQRAMANRWLGVLAGGAKSANPLETRQLLDDLNAMPEPLGAAYMLMLGELCTHGRSDENDPRLIACIQRLLEHTALTRSAIVSLSAAFMYEIFPPSLLLAAFGQCPDEVQRNLMNGIEVTSTVMPLIFHVAMKDLASDDKWNAGKAAKLLSSLQLETASDKDQATIKDLQDFAYVRLYS